MSALTIPPGHHDDHTTRAGSILPPGSREIGAQQVSAILRILETHGVLSGRAERVSARIDAGLLAAAAQKAGSSNTTEILRAALAAFVAPDPFVTWFLSGPDSLPADFELAI